MESRGDSGGPMHLSLSGQMSFQTMTAIQTEVRAIFEKLKPSAVTIDLGRVDYLDSAGALVLLEIEQYSAQVSIPCSFENMSEEIRGILSLVDRSAVMAAPPPPEKNSDSLIEQVGEVSLSVSRDFVNLLTFLGDLLVALFQSFLNPRSVRWGDFFFYVKRAGQDGLPIVALLSFLLFGSRFLQSVWQRPPF